MKKSFKNLAKVAAGLGAAYALTKMGERKNNQAETTKEEASVNQYDNIINKKRKERKEIQKDSKGVVAPIQKNKRVVAPFDPKGTTKGFPISIDNKFKSPKTIVADSAPGVRTGDDYIIAGKFDKFTPNQKFEGPNFKEDYANRGDKKVSTANGSQNKRREQLAAFDSKVDKINKANFKHGGMSVVARGNKLARSKPTKIC